MNVCPMLGIEVAILLNIIMSVFILPVLFFILRPNLVVISVPPGEPSIGAYVASKIIGAKIVYDVRDEWEDDMIMKSNLKIRRKMLEFVKLIMMKICY